tara:strand:- start:532 stop:702 length:171 start_codon:yes stop_codon:yes gene_type:complete
VEVIEMFLWRALKPSEILTFLTVVANKRETTPKDRPEKKDDAADEVGTGRKFWDQT